MPHQSPSVSCMYIKGYIVMYSGALLSVRFAVNSEAIQAGVFGMTPVRQHSHLNDLKGLVILLLEKRQNETWSALLLTAKHSGSTSNPSKLPCGLHRQHTN